MAEMTDTRTEDGRIGNVLLDTGKYPGEDFYCDGEVEDQLLSIARTVPEAEFGRVIEESKSWPVLYHLSPLRGNIVEWLPISKEDRVLEVGSGCGAITGTLARKAGEVTCVDLSKKRSLINAYRNRDCDNIRIHVGNFKDIEPDLPTDYDWICLIGVFEYGQNYIGGENPYVDFLKLLRSHLKEGGRIVIAIENRYGMKYFAGCKEDHLGTYFGGIEGYEKTDGVRTFGRKGLEKIFAACGVEEAHFYYPYPDYKFMTQLYSDHRLPEKGELSLNIRNFDRDRMLLFDEKSAYDGVVEEGLFPVFSNSYLAVLGPEPAVWYVKYSNDRDAAHSIKTEICGGGKAPVVYKYPLTQEACEHIRGLGRAYEMLSDRYQGGKLSVNSCVLEEEGGALRARFAYVRGKTLADLMDGCLERGDQEGFFKLFREYLDRIGYGAEKPVTDYDMIFSNILVSPSPDGKEAEAVWTLLDYEWTWDRSVDAREVGYRAFYCYLLENDRRSCVDRERVLALLHLSEKDAEELEAKELEFQRFVAGGHRSMAQLREDIGCLISEPARWIDRYHMDERENLVQIYEDRGEGYSEEKSYFLDKETAIADPAVGRVSEEFSISVSSEVRTLRIDPATYPCLVKIREMSWNGVPVDLARHRALAVNGRFLKPGATPEDKGGISVVFSTADPNINLRVDRLKTQKSFEVKEKNLLQVKLDVAKLPADMAGDVENAAKLF